MENLLNYDPEKPAMSDKEQMVYGLLSNMFNGWIDRSKFKSPLDVMKQIEDAKLMRDDRVAAREMRALQKQQLEASIAEQQRTSAFRDSLMQNIGPLMAGGQPQQVPMQLPELNHKQGDSNNRLYVETPQQRAHLQEQLAWLEQNDPETHKQVLSALVKQGAISQPMQTIPGNPQAWQQLAQFGALGELAGVKGASGLVELAKLQKPEYMNIDTGTGIQMVNKANPGQVYFQKGLSPNEAATQQRENIKLQYETGYGLPGAITPKQQAEIEAKQADPDAIKAKAGAVESFNSTISTAKNLLSHPGLNKSVGLWSVSPTLPGSESANFQAELETFKSQTFLPMVQQLKGMGALSNAEGEKLTQAIGALDTRMSESAFKKSLQVIIGRLEAARDIAGGQSQSNGVRRYNPATGRIE